MSHPALFKSAIVDSWSLPLGNPRRSLLATRHLRRIRKSERLGKATHGALVAYQSVALYDNAKQQSVVVAVGCSRNNAQSIAAGLTLHPKLLPGTAPEGDEPRLQCPGVAGRIEKAQHQHFAALCVLHDAGNKAVHLFEINRGLCAHRFPELR